MSYPRHGDDQARAIWPPSPGLFSLRLKRHAWAVPACIVHDKPSDQWHAEIDGEAYETHSDPTLAPMIDVVWHGGRKIDQAEYDWLFALKDWARANNPDHPCLWPRRAIDPRVLRPLIPREVH